MASEKALHENVRLFYTKLAKRKSAELFGTLRKFSVSLRRKNRRKTADIIIIMKTKFYQDKRSGTRLLAPDTEAEYPIKVAINHGGSSAYIGTGISVPASQWVSKPSPGRIIGTPLAERLNIKLTEKKLAVDKMLERLRQEGELKGKSASEIKALVEKKLDASSFGDSDGAEYPVSVCFERFIKTKNRRGTLAVYTATLAKLRAYDAFTERMTFEAVTPSWLVGFEAYLAKTSPSANARGIHLRNIRAVMNWAKKEGLTRGASYPFDWFKIRTAPTDDRSLSRDELRILYSAPCNTATEKYRDLFFLSFFLCGMNLEDILAIREKDIKGGRIEIRRIKTGQPLSIKIEPEAWAIIEKWRGKDSGMLVHFTDGRDYKSFQHRVNDYLKDIGKTYNPHTFDWEGESIIAGISFYWARYSWATLAAELDIPEKVAGFGMGHNTAKSVTSIYTRVDMRKKLDRANRAIIDYTFPKNDREDIENKK